MTTFTLTVGFSCSHFYNQKKWDENKNFKTFGKCYSKYGHGHDYKLEVTYKISNSKDLDKDIKLNILKQISERLDHKHLNFEIEDFKNKIPTTENIALFCLNEISSLDPESEITNIRLYERPDVFVEIEC